MKKHVILLLAMSFLIVMAFAVMDKDNNACAPMKMDQKKMGNGMDQHKNMMEMLKLTVDQKAQMKTIMVGHEKEMNTTKADLENLQIDKRNLLSQQKFDDAKKVVDQINAKQAQMERSGIDTHKQMWNMLTDEQKKIAKENKMSMGMGMMDGDRPGPGGPMGPRNKMDHKGMKNQKMAPKNMENCDGGNCAMPCDKGK
jgi:Spy/CpxP family protein refolding chaperone